MKSTDGQSVHLTVNEFDLMDRKIKKKSHVNFRANRENWHVIAVARWFTFKPNGPEIADATNTYTKLQNKRIIQMRFFTFIFKNHLVVAGAADAVFTIKSQQQINIYRRIYAPTKSNCAQTEKKYSTPLYKHLSAVGSRECHIK